jgi:hypothetical protein
MKIETLEDVLNELADKFMVYGACKSEDDDGCENENTICCRVGFMMVYEEKIRQAIENEKKLELVGL